ncbi:hypothetical protein DY000_02052397 [Brassica cretica]|uniref:Uncharacterized protein n=1 Tax=Brassica cretica TaxID=69181 RepID=A0ABQ7A5P1_BRACR|nr:hypothetical protein DY000_02052397 [Brassica cretica]
MADFGTPEQMAASMQQMQQQMQQMQELQQTIAAQQLAAQREPPVPIGEKIDDLAAKVDLLLKHNQNQIYVMEETNLEPGTTDVAAETETSEEDQQEVSYVNGQGWQFKNYHPNPNVRNKTNPDNPNDRSQGNQFQNTGYQKPYFQNQNQNQNQNGKMFILNELKGMMQQLLQGQQIQEKALNQATGNTPRKNIQEYHGLSVELRSGRHLSDPVPKKLTAQEKGKQKEGEPPSLEDVHDDDHELEQPTTAEPLAPTTQDQPVPTRVYIPKVPYPVPAKKSRK